MTQMGKFPEMVQRGINVWIGTDGNNASNYSDLMRATYLVAGLFKDASDGRADVPGREAYEMATLGGARTMLMEDQIGALVPGKRADVVLHDTDRPEWRPLLNVMNQLVWSADGRGRAHRARRRPGRRRGRPLHDHRRGEAVGRCPAMGEAITARSGLPDKAKSPLW